MKTLSCADLGIMNCNFVARGNTEAEVIEKSWEHGRTVHPDKISGMDKDKMMSMMKSKVKDAAM